MEAHMTAIKTIALKQHEEMFVTLDEALSSLPDRPIEGCSPAELTALRLVLHSLEAIDNYFASQPPPNFGEYLVYGKRSSSQPGDFPAYADIRAYLTEARNRTRGYLTALADEDFLSGDNNWDWEPLSLFFYVTNHTYAHMGHLDQLLYGSSDPRGWKCFSHSFERE